MKKQLSQMVSLGRIGLLTVLCAWNIPLFAQATWQLNGSSAYYNAGSVGIGTGNPQAKLELLGDGSNLVMRAPSASGYASFRLYNDQNFALRALEIGYAGTAYAFAAVNGGVVGESAYLSSTGAYPMQFATGNTFRMIITSAGRVGIGTTTPATPLHVIGDATFTGTVTGGNIQAQYQDVAEWVPSSRNLAPGTVVTLDPQHSNNVLPSSTPYDTRVAGVVSEKPGLLLGQGGEGKIKIATTGRLKVRVRSDRPVKVGDLLVTSQEEGMAMVSEPIDVGGVKIHRPGTLIGKALEPMKPGTGEILVLLSLQ